MLRLFVRFSLLFGIVFMVGVMAAQSVGRTFDTPQLSYKTISDFFLLDVRTGIRVALFTHWQSHPNVFDWSPDGRFLLGSHFVEGDTSLSLWDSQTGQSVRHIAFIGVYGTGKWSPDSRYFSYKESGDVCIYTALRWERRCLALDEPLSNRQHPTWSPDSRRLAWATTQGDICIYTLDTDMQACLGVTDADFPDWQDDNHLIYVYRRVYFYRISLTTGETTQMIETPTPIDEFAILPNGTQIVYQSFTQQYPITFTLVDVETGAFERLTQEERAIRFWGRSHDGRFLALVEHLANSIESILTIADATNPDNVYLRISESQIYAYRWRPQGAR